MLTKMALWDKVFSKNILFCSRALYLLFFLKPEQFSNSGQNMATHIPASTQEKAARNKHERYCMTNDYILGITGGNNRGGTYQMLSGTCFPYICTGVCGNKNLASRENKWIQSYSMYCLVSWFNFGSC